MPGLLNVQSGLLRAPFERDLNVPGECFCTKTGRLPALHMAKQGRKRSDATSVSMPATLRPLCQDSRRFWGFGVFSSQRSPAAGRLLGAHP
jgi:hypothetical protein